MPEQSDLKLLFLDTALFEDGAVIRGGSLITDIETRPYEFRCTSPVRPTSLQRMLYGDTLEEYIYIELIGAPLIKAAKEKPSLVLVRSSLLLRLRPFVEYPVVLIRREQTPIVSSATEDQQVIRPVTVSAHREFSSEAVAAQAMLTQLMQRRDLLEPFERLQVALNEAHRQHVGEGTSGGGRA